MAEADALLRLLARAEGWTRPRFPVSGQDLLAEGMAEGPALGETLRSLEERWLDSGFRLTREELLFLARMSG